MSKATSENSHRRRCVPDGVSVTDAGFFVIRTEGGAYWTGTKFTFGLRWAQRFETGANPFNDARQAADALSSADLPCVVEYIPHGPTTT
jgi:hypothetical protein